MPLPATRHLWIVVALSTSMWGCSSLKPSAPMQFGGPNTTSLRQEESETLVERYNPKRVVARIRGEEPDKDVAQAIFLQAEDQFRAAASAQGESRREAFEEAGELYAKAAVRGKGFPVEEDALWMNAECHFFADNYAKASDAYGKLVKNYPNTQHLDGVDSRRFKIAEYWVQQEKTAGGNFSPNLVDKRFPVLDKFGHAAKLLDRIRFDDPTGELSDDATMALAVAYFERGKYVKADELFSDLRENFPSSQHQFDAHLLGLKAKMLSYEGPDYDGGPLDEAEAIIRSMAAQFPEQTSQQADVLERAFKDIRLQKAQREFALAQYYDRREEYRAARMHYENVQRDFSDTNLAVESESRLAQIKGLPDVPKESLEWLQHAFPAHQERQEPLLRRNPLGAVKK